MPRRRPKTRAWLRAGLTWLPPKHPPLAAARAVGGDRLHLFSGMQSLSVLDLKGDLKMSRQITSTLRLLCAALAAATLAFVLTQPSLAKQYSDEETAALLQVLNNSKLGLADGVRQVSKGSEAAISAKFELDDNKKLSLSVYTAEKGLGQDAEHNILKEFSGSPAQTPWSPEAEVFKDIPHVSRASEHLALMALAKQPLADLIAMTQKQHKGTVFSAIPEVQNHRPVLLVLVADQGKVNEYRYDLVTGQAVQ